MLHRRLSKECKDFVIDNLSKKITDNYKNILEKFESCYQNYLQSIINEQIPASDFEILKKHGQIIKSRRFVFYRYEIEESRAEDYYLDNVLIELPSGYVDKSYCGDKKNIISVSEEQYKKINDYRLCINQTKQEIKTEKNKLINTIESFNSTKQIIEAIPELETLILTFYEIEKVDKTAKKDVLSVRNLLIKNDEE